MNNVDGCDVPEGRILNILRKHFTQNMRNLVADVENNCRSHNVATGSWISYYITTFDGNSDYKM
jgi:hypothetical protein